MTSPLLGRSDIPVATIAGPECSCKRRWHSIVSGQAQGWVANATRLLLEAVSYLYLLGLKVNLALYTTGLKSLTEPALPAISVGNLTLGGTGKTTTVQFLARRLLEANIIPGVVLRGYRRMASSTARLIADGQRVLSSVSEAGDEAYMLAESLPAVPVAVGKRREAAIDLLAQQTTAQIALLDDGFQYFRMNKLLDIVLIDATKPFIGQRLFPAGYLREPLSHLCRADQIWITHADQIAPEDLDDLRDTLSTIVPSIPVVVTRHTLLSLHSFDGQPMSPTQLSGRRILAVSGIGNPQSFETTLQQAGAEVIPLRYADHHFYRSEDAQYIQKMAREQQVDIVACTRKDAVKWPIANGAIPVVIVDCQLEILSGSSNIQIIMDTARQAVAATEYE